MKRLSMAVVLLALAACDAKMLGIPPVAVSAKSPDGRYVAFVRNHPTIDPPEQSIWLGGTQIERLGGDVDWCRRIVWSDDSSRVAYLIQDARLVVVDARSAKPVASVWLVPHDAYPTSHAAECIKLTPEGVQYDDCVRGTATCSRKTLPLG